MTHSEMWYTTRGSGAATLILLTGVVILGIITSTRWEGETMSRTVVQGLHRNLSLLAITFLPVHVLLAVLDPFTHLGLMVALVPFVSPYRPLWLGLGVISFELIVALVVSSLIRLSIGYKTWRALHWLAYLAWPLAWAHGIGAGSDGKSQWLWIVNGLCLVAVAGALDWRFRTKRRALRSSQNQA